MKNITLGELLFILENEGLNLTWCKNDKWNVERAFLYLKDLSSRYPSDIRIEKDLSKYIRVYYKGKPIQEYEIKS